MFMVSVGAISFGSIIYIFVKQGLCKQTVSFLLLIGQTLYALFLCNFFLDYLKSF